MKYLKKNTDLVFREGVCVWVRGGRGGVLVSESWHFVHFFLFSVVVFSRDLLTLRILELRESGELEQLKKYWWFEMSECPVEKGTAKVRGGRSAHHRLHACLVSLMSWSHQGPGAQLCLMFIVCICLVSVVSTKEPGTYV